MNARREQRRGGTVGHVWPSRVVEQGVARYTHAWPWLDSNLFVTLPLQDAGFRLVTLTNSPPDPQASPLKHAGLDAWFEKAFSIDRVRRFKPAPQVYHMVAEALDVPPAALCLVAAHVWDTIGAQSIGCSGALITRAGNAPLPVHGVPQPQAVAPDLPGLATQLIKLWR